MSRLDINVKNLTSCNAKLPRLVNRTNALNRKVSLMKWRIPEDIQAELDLKSELKEVAEGLSFIEEQIDNLHSAVDAIITTVINTEDSLSASADEFE